MNAHVYQRLQDSQSDLASSLCPPLSQQSLCNSTAEHEQLNSQLPAFGMINQSSVPLTAKTENLTSCVQQRS